MWSGVRLDFQVHGRESVGRSLLSLKETTIESTQKAAQAKLIQEAAEKKRLEEEERLREEKRQANG